MKVLVTKMISENSSHNDLRKESLYSASNGYLQWESIARQADNLHWLLDILIFGLLMGIFWWNGCLSLNTAVHLAVKFQRQWLICEVRFDRIHIEYRFDGTSGIVDARLHTCCILTLSPLFPAVPDSDINFVFSRYSCHIFFGVWVKIFYVRSIKLKKCGSRESLSQPPIRSWPWNFFTSFIFSLLTYDLISI